MSNARARPMISLFAVLGLITASCVAGNGPAAAQVPQEIEAKLIAIGPIVAPQETAALYRSAHGIAPYDDISLIRDVRYGPNDRHRLDIAKPAGLADGARPAIIFVHGGAFTRGDKSQDGSPFYDNVVVWAARNGFIGINMTYRRAPEFPWPAGADDVAAAFVWARLSVAAHGGNPDQIYVMGHSAGATHVAGFLARASADLSRTIAGAILVSGLYELNANTVGDPERAYFGSDPASYLAREALPGLVSSGVPLWVGAGEIDRTDFVAQAARLRQKLCEAGRCPAGGVLAGHSHMSSVYAIGTADASVTTTLISFIRGARRP
jgi:triacylglycerol lipase